MKKHTRLRLSAETIRHLDRHQLSGAVGGYITSNFTSMATDCCETGTSGPGPTPVSASPCPGSANPCPITEGCNTYRPVCA